MGSAGTQLLPESQVDRFMVRLSIGYPAPKDEADILKRSQGRELLREVRQTVDATDILRMQEETESIYMNDDIRDYIVRLAVATRNHPLIRLGVSPRASIALARLSQSIAWLSGRDYVIPPDVISVLPDVFGHRLSLNPQAGIGGETVAELLAGIMKDVSPPKIAREKTAPRP
jgi:MoxR-like ATPase